MDIKTKVKFVGNLLIILGFVPLILFIGISGYSIFTGQGFGKLNFTPDLSFLLMIFLGRELKLFNASARSFTLTMSTAYLLTAVAAVSYISIVMPSFITGFLEMSSFAGSLILIMLSLYTILPIICLLFLAGSKNKEKFKTAM